MLKLKLQYFGHLMWRDDSLEKTLMLGKIEGGRRRGWQRMRWLDGITDSTDMSLGKLWEMVMDRDGLACCSPRSHKELDTTEWLNWTELNWKRQQFCLFIDESWCLAYNNCLIGICQMNVDASFHFPLQLKMGEVCFLHKVNSQPGFCVSQYVSPDPITHSSGGVC